jgi:hypothetical protein
VRHLARLRARRVAVTVAVAMRAITWTQTQPQNLLAGQLDPEIGSSTL